MDFYVVLDRPGYRVSRRRRAVARVGVQHRVTKDDAIKWFQTKFEGGVPLPPPPPPLLLPLVHHLSSISLKPTRDSDCLMPTPALPVSRAGKQQ